MQPYIFPNILSRPPASLFNSCWKGKLRIDFTKQRKLMISSFPKIYYVQEATLKDDNVVPN